MPGFLLHTLQLMDCPHGGMIQTASNNTRVLINGVPVATLSDSSTVVGCAFTVPPGKSQPCVTVKWTPVVATSVLVNGKPVLLSGSTTICQSIEQIPQGPALQLTPQPRVSAR